MTSSHKGPERFLFLEFLDPEINALLTGLRKEFSGDEQSTSVHITVRGPYEGNIPGDDIERYERLLKVEPILIHGAGKFKNGNQYVVFIRVSSTPLKKIWWKPDFPIEKYGFNPHVTLFKGRESVLADEILKFLKHEDIALLCHDFRLTPYAAKQADMFPVEPAPLNRQFLQLSNRRLIKADVLQRAANLIRRHKAGSAAAGSASVVDGPSSGQTKTM